MAKTKSKAVILASDGSGAVRQTHDRRFEKAEWPIRLVIEDQAQADTWFKYLSAECTARGWSSGVMAQLDAKENSGSSTVTASGAGAGSELIIVWERRRNGPLSLRARVVGDLSEEVAAELLERATEKCRAAVREIFRLRGQLHYDGLPWKGELWLSDDLRLGPPSKQDETALLGPRVILVDAQVAGIDRLDASGRFAVLCRELSSFLAVVLRMRIGAPQSGRAWTFADIHKPEGSQVRWLGYLEPEGNDEMPVRGAVAPVPLAAIRRPDFSLHGLWPDDREVEPPADIIHLWEQFVNLDTARRQQFLQVASVWQLALSLGHEYQTTAFAWKVVAVEALKPKDCRDHNIYDVVEALLGTPIADVLRRDGIRPQDIRNAHLHRGEFRGSEFAHDFMMTSFHDPTFDSAHRVLTNIAEATIIEWLRRGGAVTLAPLGRRRSWRRSFKTSALVGVGLAAGVFLGWIGHTLLIR